MIIIIIIIKSNSSHHAGSHKAAETHNHPPSTETPPGGRIHKILGHQFHQRTAIMVKKIFLTSCQYLPTLNLYLLLQVWSSTIKWNKALPFYKMTALQILQNINLLPPLLFSRLTFPIPTASMPKGQRLRPPSPKHPCHTSLSLLWSVTVPWSCLLQSQTPWPIKDSICVLRLAAALQGSQAGVFHITHCQSLQTEMQGVEPGAFHVQSRDKAPPQPLSYKKASRIGCNTTNWMWSV